MWWRRTGNVAAARGLTSAVVSQMELFDAGGSGRVLFEIGAACKGNSFDNDCKESNHVVVLGCKAGV
jgi:hypothetical protein